MSAGREANRRMATVRRFVERWNARDVDGVLDCFTPDAELIFPPEVPEPGPFHGRDQLRGWMEGFLGAWDEHRVEIEQMESAGDELLVVSHHRARGRGTGLELNETDGSLFSFAGESISRWRDYSDPEEARREAGLNV